MTNSDIAQIETWNSRVSIERSDDCVHDLFSHQANSNPSAEAISSWDGTLTYTELDTLSTTLARRIINRRIPRQSYVALILDKSKWTAVSLLAVLKAGCAFFFVDPSLPDQRVKRMCEIAGAAGIITSSDQVDRVNGLSPVTMVAEDECRNPREEVNMPDTSPDQPAYLAFTSGSSGDPKAVVLSHSAACSGMPAYSKAMGLHKTSRMLQFASYSFVISVLDHLGALLNGATLCVPSSDQILNDLSGAINALNANFVEMTPSVARVLEPEAVPCLQTVVLTGEAATRADLEKWMGRVELKTCYGQSENSKGALVDDKTPNSEAGDMGYPFGAHCWVVNADSSEIVPVGSDGELWIEGPSLATGYLGIQEQTDAAFIWDPSWFKNVYPGKSSRFLRTGDLVRVQAGTGLLQYVGRLGTQVKLRGQRIELAEVEGELKKVFPGSDTVAEIVKTGQDENDAVLAAFVTVDGSTVDDSVLAAPTLEFSEQVKEATARLRESLPQFMIPGSFLPVSALPLTPSGKLNRKVLREKAAELGSRLQTYHLLSSQDHRPPYTDEETRLRDICADILASKSEEISMDATFFELGGNSLSAMKLASTAREAGFNFTTSNIFQQLSLATLAEYRGDAVQSPASNGTVDKERFVESIPSGIDASNVAGIFPCTSIQKYFLETHNGGNFILHFSGPLDTQRLRAACQRLVDTHASLRSFFTLHNETIVQVVLKEINLPFEEHHTSEDTKSVAETLAKKCIPDCYQRFSLDKLPLQFTLIAGNAGCSPEHALLIQLGHTQMDGSSQQTLVSDICAFYKDPAQAPSAPDFIPYAEAIAQRQTEESFSFWRDHLEGSDLTRIHPPAEQNKDFDLDSLSIFSCTETIPIPHLPKGITLATAVKAAWAQTLHGTTGDTDILFAQLLSLRDVEFNVPNIDRLLGPCLNRVPVRVQIQDQGKGQSGTGLDPDLLNSIQTQHSQSIPHHAAQWETLVERSTPWDRGTQPQSLLVHQNFELTSSYTLDGGVTCSLAGFVAAMDPQDRIEVSSSASADGQELSVELSASDSACSEEELRGLLGRFCKTFKIFKGV